MIHIDAIMTKCNSLSQLQIKKIIKNNKSIPQNSSNFLRGTKTIPHKKNANSTTITRQPNHKGTQNTGTNLSAGWTGKTCVTNDKVGTHKCWLLGCSPCAPGFSSMLYAAISITKSKISYSLIKPEPLLPVTAICCYKFHILATHPHPTFTAPQTPSLPLTTPGTRTYSSTRWTEQTRVTNSEAATHIKAGW